LKPLELAVDQAQIDALISLLIGNLREVPEATLTKKGRILSAGPTSTIDALADLPTKQLSSYDQVETPRVRPAPHHHHHLPPHLPLLPKHSSYSVCLF